MCHVAGACGHRPGVPLAATGAGDTGKTAGLRRMAGPRSPNGKVGPRPAAAPAAAASAIPAIGHGEVEEAGGRRIQGAEAVGAEGGAGREAHTAACATGRQRKENKIHVAMVRDGK